MTPLPHLAPPSPLSEVVSTLRQAAYQASHLEAHPDPCTFLVDHRRDQFQLLHFLKIGTGYGPADG